MSFFNDMFNKKPIIHNPMDSFKSPGSLLPGLSKPVSPPSSSYRVLPLPEKDLVPKTYKFPKPEISDPLNNAKPEFKLPEIKPPKLPELPHIDLDKTGQDIADIFENFKVPPLFDPKVLFFGGIFVLVLMTSD